MFNLHASVHSIVELSFFWMIGTHVQIIATEILQTMTAFEGLHLCPNFPKYSLPGPAISSQKIKETLEVETFIRNVLA